MTGDDDRRDMQELAAGRHEALERLYKRYGQRLASFFWRMGSAPGEGDELVQDVFIQLWRHRGAWRGEGQLTTYLFGIARTVWLASREARDGSAAGLEAISGPEAPPAHAELERRELAGVIETAIAALPEPLRLVFSLGTAGGLKYREIAALLGIPVGTVKSRMYAAHEQLRAQLSGYLGAGRR